MTDKLLTCIDGQPRKCTMGELGYILERKSPHNYFSTNTPSIEVGVNSFQVIHMNDDIKTCYNELTFAGIKPAITAKLSDGRFMSIIVIDTVLYDITTIKSIQRALNTITGNKNRVSKNICESVNCDSTFVNVYGYINNFGEFYQYIGSILSSLPKSCNNLPKLSDSELNVVIDVINNISTEKPPVANNINESQWDTLLSAGIMRRLNSEKVLDLPTLIGLASNLRAIRGGLTHLKKAMKANGNYPKYAFGVIPFIKKFDYNPIHMENFTESPEAQTLAHYALNKKGTVKKTNRHKATTNMMTIEQAEVALKDVFQKALNSNDRKIHIIKCPTGLGKTRLLETLDDNVTIAFPTHALKDEVYERMGGETCSNVVSRLDPPEINDVEASYLAKYYHRIGLSSLASKIVSKHCPKRESVKYKESLNPLKSKTYLTTHRSAVVNSSVHDTIIFDEDPLDSFLETGEVNVSDFTSIMMNSDDPVIRDYMNSTVHELSEIVSAYREGVFKRPHRAQYIDERLLVESILKTTVSTDIFSYLKSHYVCSNAAKGDRNTVYYLTKRDLPDRNIIILSATAPVELYRKLYKDRVVVHDVSDVETVGSVIQNTTNSFSRTACYKLKHKLNEYIDQSLPTITFKTVARYLDNPAEGVYFGNCEGYDTLRGQDINVMGTPHFSPILYKLYAAASGMTLDAGKLDFDYIKVEHNGFAFKFNAYTHPEMREIQLSLIESQLLQAVGRARALRYDCTVYVYSNFPLKHARHV